MMKIGINKWMESIEDEEEVNIIIRKVDVNRNGNYYLQALREDDSQFFMCNIGENQGDELRDAEYAVMKCTGHGVNGYPYLTFTVVPDFNKVDRWKQTTLTEEEDEDEGQTYYPMDLEKDVLNILKCMYWMDYDSNDEWFVDVREGLFRIMSVLYRRKLERLMKD